MRVFETLLVLLLGATALSAFARRLNIPYPALLALGGALLAVVPGAPRLDLPPELILALFVAPILLDAAYDASLRDLKRNWIPVVSLVLGAVGFTVVAVAFAARALLPEMPWAAAIALGAVVAPPDAVAALAVLRALDPPVRVRMVLEGESLLNDASALMTYRLALAALAAGSFSLAHAAPTFLLVVLGSVLLGWLAAWPSTELTKRVEDAPSSVILQFVTTFGLWLLAEHLGLSGVVTVVVAGFTMAQRTAAALPAHLRVPSFAIWETVTVVLNVLAFVLVGLQIRPILADLERPERVRYLLAAVAILGVVVLVRLLWTFSHHGLAVLRRRLFGGREGRSRTRSTAKETLVIGWSGMRGIVTLAAAMALPASFPSRDFAQLTAFVVVLGTLLLQGLTLGPLLHLLKFPRDTMVEDELKVAREAMLGAALAALDGKEAAAAERLRQEFADALLRVRDGRDLREAPDNVLRRRVVAASRSVIDELRRKGEIGDDAYRRAEEELDWLELSARSGNGRY